MKKKESGIFTQADKNTDTETFSGESIGNWEDPSSYPRPSDLNARRWAWEFLRRNPKYQLRFNRAKRDLKSTRAIATAGLFGLSKFKDHRHEFDDGGGPIYKDLRISWVTAVDFEKPFNRIIRPHELLVVADLRIPKSLDKLAAKRRILEAIDGLLERRMDGATGDTKSYPRHTSLFPTYIRLLDAVLDGVPVTKIVKVMAPNKIDSDKQATRNIRSQIATAKLIANKEYWDIAFSTK